MTTHTLQDVFGVYFDPPSQTYVDRSGFDQRLQYLLSSNRHIVIYGPSKQGKTALRKRAIPDNFCVIIQCRNRPGCEQIYTQILRELGTERVASRQFTEGNTSGVGGETTAELTLPGAFKVGGKFSGNRGKSKQGQVSTSTFGQNTEDIGFIANAIKDSALRVVIEDFHYIPEEDKQSFASDLKAFFEYGVPFILIGAWEEQHVLATYNGDLSGRVDEINVRWNDYELREILTLGQQALNIKIASTLVESIVVDASGNVGLLQRIAERFCMEAGRYESYLGNTPFEINNLNFLNQARRSICVEEAQRYRKFGWSVSEGFANSNEATKNVYMRIIQVCVQAGEAELLAGLSQQTIEERVAQLDSSVNPRAIREALQRIDKLQSEKAIYPVIATFNPVSRVLNLADRELLFYRKYGGPNWPWEDGD